MAIVRATLLIVVSCPGRVLDISGVIVTNEGVVVVDALSSDAIAWQVREAIAGVTPQPVRSNVSRTDRRTKSTVSQRGCDPK
jgi:hypothetical protein